MSALSLITEFSERGIRITPNGKTVKLSPKTALTPDLLDRVRVEKPSLLRELERIRKEAGVDWDDIAKDPVQLKAFYELSMISDMRARGVAPNHYTSTSICKHCGPIPIWEGCPPKIIGCPWCFNRVKGLPMPKSYGRENG